MPAFVEVLVDVASVGTDRPFSYRVPPALDAACQPGARVLVPFGRRRVEGIVLRRVREPGVEETRDVLALVEAPGVARELLELAEWVAARYACLVVQAVRAMLPSGTRLASGRPVRPRTVPAVRPAAGRAELAAAAAALRRRAPRQAAVLDAVLALWDGPGMPRPWPVADVARRAGAGPEAVRALVARGLLGPDRLEVRRDPHAARPFRAGRPPQLTPAQARAVEAIVAALPRRAGVPGSSPRAGRAFLLYGVPASGKTEVYLRAIAAALDRGLTAICLVPEIALTPQIADAFRARFGPRVAVLHSALGAGERYDEWRRAAAGEVRVVVGARSAVFAPLPELGLVVVDEEHEPSYKQAEDPKYHAREVALERARSAGAVVVLGSATPALETAYRTVRGEFQRLDLPERVVAGPGNAPGRAGGPPDRGGRPPAGPVGASAPEVAVVDLREELSAGHKSVFSRLLQAALEETLARGEQAILFLNRRGYATFVLCRDCGLALRCPHCDVSLVYHAAEREVRCHYCGHRQGAPERCPQCAGHRMRHFGLGTQRVEEALQQAFPGVRALRMDADTTRTKGAHEAILDAFARREADVLVGTQMIAKGLHLPGVTLVGVLAADTTLNLPDFRAAERTFQLLFQVAGRAGRGERPGRAIIQTFAPDHYAVVAAARGDYPGFYRQELAARRAAGYPPFTQLVSFVTHAPEEAAARRAAEDVAAFIAGMHPEASRIRPGVQRLGPGLELLGPAPAPLARLKGRWRWQCLLKAAGSGRTPPGAAAPRIARQVHAHYNTGGWPWSRPRRGGAERPVRLLVDVDPADLL